MLDEHTIEWIKNQAEYFIDIIDQFNKNKISAAEYYRKDKAIREDIIRRKYGQSGIDILNNEIAKLQNIKNSSV